MRTVAKSILSIAMTLGAITPMFLWQYESDTQLAHRWVTDNKSVVDSVYRVKRYTQGDQVLYYAVEPNLREINRYSVCTNTPDNCKSTRN